MLKARVKPYTLKFKFLARTSRETFKEKKSYFLEIYDDCLPAVKGVGEVAPFPSLQPSFVDEETFERTLTEVAQNVDAYVNGLPLPENSAVRFGFESAMADFAHGGKGLLYPRAILEKIGDGIKINGLIWMDSIDKMMEQIDEKIRAGFTCVKLKIGNNDFEKELELLRILRNTFRERDLELRVDANGAFTECDVLQKLERLSALKLHSIEQPLPRDNKKTVEICRVTPLPIALDEDMIERWWSPERMFEWLSEIRPQYVVLKPSLVGGFEMADRWIRVAKELGIGWWATSALESNVGLSAITQWLATHHEDLHLAQGLGTGNIYANNVPGMTRLVGERIFINI